MPLINQHELEVKSEVNIDILELYRPRDKNKKKLQHAAEQMNNAVYNDYITTLDAEFINKALQKSIPKPIETRHKVAAVLGMLTLGLGLLGFVAPIFGALCAMSAYFFFASIFIVTTNPTKINSIITLSAKKLTSTNFRYLIEKASPKSLLKHIAKNPNSIMRAILENQSTDNIILLIQKLLQTRKQPKFLSLDVKYTSTVVQVVQAEENWSKAPWSLTNFLKLQPPYLGEIIAKALITVYLAGNKSSANKEAKDWLLNYCKGISASDRGRFYLNILATLPRTSTEKFNQHLEKLERLFSLACSVGTPVWSFDHSTLENVFDKLCQNQSLECGSLFLQKLIRVSGKGKVYELNPSSIAEIMLLPSWSNQPDDLQKLIKLLNPSTYETIATNCRALSAHHGSPAPSPALNQWINTILKENRPEINPNVAPQTEANLADTEVKQDSNLEEQNIKKAIDCFKQKRALAKVVRPEILNQYITQLENPNDRSHEIRRTLNQTRGYKYVHLENKIVKYVKKRKIKPPHIYIKKNSHSYISPNLRTPLFGTHHIDLPLVGYVSDRNLCKVKAYLTKDKGTVNHNWVGDYFSVLGYWFDIRTYNAKNFEEFEYKLSIQSEDNTNELLVKNNKESMVAVIVGRETLRNKLLAIQYKKVAEAKLNKTMLPILFYDSALGTLKPYRIKQQEIDLAVEKSAELAVRNVCNFLLSITNWKINTNNRFFFSPLPKEVVSILKRVKVCEFTTMGDFSYSWQDTVEAIKSILNPTKPLVVSDETKAIYKRALEMLEPEAVISEEKNAMSSSKNFAAMKNTVVHSFGL